MADTTLRVAVFPVAAEITTVIDPAGGYRTIEIGANWSPQVSIYLDRPALHALQAALDAIRADFDAGGAVMKGEWNGEPAEVRRVVVKVGEPLRPTWWCARLEGQEWDAVEVRYGGRTFFLDDSDGSGWAKVIFGHGSPNVSHRSLPDSSVVVADRDTGGAS